MKSRILVITLSLFTTLLTACPSHNTLLPGLGGGGSKPGGQSQGGVDVGNLVSAIVPETNTSLTYPKDSWSSSTQDKTLKISNRSGSTIEAKRAEIKDLSSPSAIALQRYLKVKYPERDYQIIKLNGLDGVRAELASAGDQKTSDIYLVSAAMDFIHIQSQLHQADNGITEGDQIILSTRVKFRGVAYENPQVKTVTLQARNSKSPDRHAYSFWGDCFTYSDKDCNPLGGEAIAYEGQFQIGTAGYEHGRVVELGSEKDVPFDSIRVDGEYLVSSVAKLPIADIYTESTPQTIHREVDHIDLKPGFVYLVRTINWPDEDLITKMRVENLNGGDSATITYQKLVYQKKDELQAQIDALNKYTRENEMPLSTGEVTLYNYTTWGTFFFASFNFQYSTSGNMYITHNSWDLLFETNGSGNPVLSVPHTGSGIGLVTDLGFKDPESVTSADFPDPNTYKGVRGTPTIKGHTYAVMHYDYGDEDNSAVFAAVQVLDLSEKNDWVHLKFRRMKITRPNHFQKWIELGVPVETQHMTLEGNSSKATFYPFINKRADQGSHYYESLYFGASQEGKDYLAVDDRPFGKDRGLFKFGKNIALESVTQDSVESLKGKFERFATLEKGDVIAFLLENYYDRTILVMRIDDAQPGKSVTFSYRYLQRAKTAYSDDQD